MRVEVIAKSEMIVKNMSDCVIWWTMLLCRDSLHYKIIWFIFFFELSPPDLIIIFILLTEKWKWKFPYPCDMDVRSDWLFFAFILIDLFISYS